MAAAPSLPTAKNTNDILDNSWVDAVYDGLELNRNTRPVFKSQCTTAAAGGDQGAVPDATDTEAGISDGAGSFNYTPDINIGTFTAGTAGETGLYLPLDGIYMVVASVEWESNGTGYRQVGVKNEGAYFDDSRARLPAVSGGVTRQQVSVMINATGGNEITLHLLQNSTTSLDAEVFVSIYWLVDS